MDIACSTCGRLIGAAGMGAHTCVVRSDVRGATAPRRGAQLRMGEPQSMRDMVDTARNTGPTVGQPVQTTATFSGTYSRMSAINVPLPSQSAVPGGPIPGGPIPDGPVPGDHAPGGPPPAAPRACCSTATVVGTASATTPKEGDIRIEFHPRARRAALHLTISEYEKLSKVEINVDKEKLNQTPWFPAFNTEFRLRGLAFRSQYRADPSQLTIQSYDEMQLAWDAAGAKLPSFKESIIETDYGKSEDTKKRYSVWHRDPWEWAKGLVRDPILAPFFTYHAYRQFRYIGGDWVQFVTEPPSAKEFWDMESSLPDRAHPLAFEIYADKTRLSSFGSQKAYPVIARIANLPMHLRHGTEYGGGQFVGFLPIVEEEEEEGETEFIALKRVVWHEGIWQILKNMAIWAGYGDNLHCGDDIARILIPVIIILIADYEEQ